MANAEIRVDLTDNIDDLKNYAEEVIARALEEVGLDAVNYVAELVPVDTGRLRGSITHEVQGHSVIVGTNVDYAQKVEFTEIKHKVGQAHYLRDGINNNLEDYKRIIKDVLNEG